MAGIRFTVDDRELRRRLDAIQGGLEDATPLMRVWGEIMERSVAKNFESGGRPPWPRLAPATIRKKGHDRPLIGRTGNLSKIVTKAEPDKLVIGTQPSARAYAAIHQFGGQAGRGHKVKIPARPFIVLQGEDREEMGETARSYLRRLAGSN